VVVFPTPPFWLKIAILAMDSDTERPLRQQEIN
jgi:hypothetical protein